MHFESWHRSDLTQQDYCVSHALGEKTVYRWRHKEMDAASTAKSSLTLVPVSISAPATSNNVRIHNHGGWRIELQSEPTLWLAELFRQLP